MNRRQFLKSSLTTAAVLTAAPFNSFATTPAAPRNTAFDKYFFDIYAGFIKNGRATGPDYVVCDYKDGTKLKGCCTPSGKTYVSVARMLPAMTEWLAAGRSSLLVTNPEADMREIVQWIFRKAFEPQHPDFWGYPPADKATQRTVESALVASALITAGNDMLAKLTAQERSNINKWLTSCTQVPERKTNHAWFTAINQAARLELSRTFEEFEGDEAWMLEDLKALDAMYGNGTDGWYSDSPDQPIYDTYNFYVFPNFPLMWSAISGQRYPDWNEKFRARVKLFCERAPHFFGSNGSVPHMGRSLCYRWAVLSPLALAYREKLWPHSPGLLRTIVRKNLEYHWNLGCFDETRGKLRETFSRDETPVTREPYIDNGHPYWSMLGFAFYGIPESDEFWTAPEEPLPVEKGDYLLRFEGPKFLLQGIQRTGEVRWIQSQNSAKRDTYRDKYAKFVWSSHFGYCASAADDKKNIPPDQALVFRHSETGECATRAPNSVTASKLTHDGVETTWFAQLGDWKFEVTSLIPFLPVCTTTHFVTAPQEAVGKIEVLEGGFAAPKRPTQLTIVQGYERVEEHTLDNVNLIHRTVKLHVAVGSLSDTQQVFSVLEDPVT